MTDAPSTRENPWPVAGLSQKLRDYIDRLGSVWVEGEITQWGAGTLGSFEGDTVLIAFDGSDEARGAIEYAGRFLSTRNIYILTVWEPIHRQAARTAGMSGMMQHDWSSVTDDTEDPAYSDAVAICREGVSLAEAQGFTTEPFLVESATAIWSAIVDAARELDVSIIVAGSRALSGWRSLLQSSVSDSLVKHAGRPVLIVPPVEDEDEDSTDTADSADTASDAGSGDAPTR